LARVISHFDNIYDAEYNKPIENIKINPKNVRNSDSYRSERKAIAGRSFREALGSHRRGRGE